jgi:uncharacterized protein YbjQ (UPF0145 family)
MKALIAMLFSSVMLASPVTAAEVLEFSIDDVMASVRATETLKSDISFYHSGQDSLLTTKVLSAATTQQKINGFLKSDRNACELAFLAAMKELKLIALAKGGNALVNIHSSLSEDKEERKDGFYGCISKIAIAEVSLTANIVVLDD